MRLVLGISRTVVATAFVSIVSSHAFAADGGELVGQQILRRGVDRDLRRPTGFVEAGRQPQAGRYDPHRPHRPRAADARPGNHHDRAEFRGRPSRGSQGRALDHHRAAGRFDPAGSGKAQRQAFRGRDALSRRGGQGHAVSRHGERRSHQRRRHPRPGRGRRFQIRPDRPGDAGPAGDQLCARQGRPLLERIGHP